MKTDGDWEIIADYEDCESRCNHCGPVREEVRVPGTPNEYIKRLWTIPRVVVAYNQGGYDCTAICLDCILEAANA